MDSSDSPDLPDLSKLGPQMNEKLATEQIKKLGPTMRDAEVSDSEDQRTSDRKRHKLEQRIPDEFQAKKTDAAPPKKKPSIEPSTVDVEVPLEALAATMELVPPKRDDDFSDGQDDSDQDSPSVELIPPPEVIEEEERRRAELDKLYWQQRRRRWYHCFVTGLVLGLCCYGLSLITAMHVYFTLGSTLLGMISGLFMGYFHLDDFWSRIVYPAPQIVFSVVAMLYGWQAGDLTFILVSAIWIFHFSIATIVGSLIYFNNRRHA